MKKTVWMLKQTHIRDNRKAEAFIDLDATGTFYKGSLSEKLMKESGLFDKAQDANLDVNTIVKRFEERFGKYEPKRNSRQNILTNPLAGLLLTPAMFTYINMLIKKGFFKINIVTGNQSCYAEALFIYHGFNLNVLTIHGDCIHKNTVVEEAINQCALYRMNLLSKDMATQLNTLSEYKNEDSAEGFFVNNIKHTPAHNYFITEDHYLYYWHKDQSPQEAELIRQLSTPERERLALFKLTEEKGFERTYRNLHQKNLDLVRTIDTTDRKIPDNHQLVIIYDDDPDKLNIMAGATLATAAKVIAKQKMSWLVTVENKDEPSVESLDSDSGIVVCKDKLYYLSPCKSYETLLITEPKEDDLKKIYHSLITGRSDMTVRVATQAEIQFVATLALEHFIAEQKSLSELSIPSERKEKRLLNDKKYAVEHIISLLQVPLDPKQCLFDSDQAIQEELAAIDFYCPPPKQGKVADNTNTLSQDRVHKSPLANAEPKRENPTKREEDFSLSSGTFGL